MKPYTLKNREGESISPMTSTRTVFDERGVDLDTLLAQQKQGFENALKEYPKKTEVVEGLAGKQGALSTTTDLHITDDNIIGLTETAKMKLFDDMWRAAVGVWGDIDHGHYEDGVNKPYYLNELWFTYDEAVAVYEAGPLIDSLSPAYGDGAFTKIRTNLPAKRQTGVDYTERVAVLATGLFKGGMEVVNLNPLNTQADLYAKGPSDFSGISHYTFNARRYIGVCNLRYHKPDFVALDVTSRPVEHLLIRCLHTNAKMRCANLDLESMSFLIAEATNTSAITITVRPEVYAKLTDETNEEWYAVLEAAAEKNITFATV